MISVILKGCPLLRMRWGAGSWQPKRRLPPAATANRLRSNLQVVHLRCFYHRNEKIVTQSGQSTFFVCIFNVKTTTTSSTIKSADHSMNIQPCMFDCWYLSTHVEIYKFSAQKKISRIRHTRYQRPGTTSHPWASTSNRCDVFPPTTTRHQLLGVRSIKFVNQYTWYYIPLHSCYFFAFRVMVCLFALITWCSCCLLYTSPSPRD